MPYSNEEDALAKDIMRPHLIKVDKEDKLKKVIELMAAKKISTIIIIDKEKQSNYHLIAHSDIIDFLDQYKDNPIDLEKFKAKDLMTNVGTIPPETHMDEIIEIMLTHGYKRVIVESKRHIPLGIITQHDILTWNSRLFQPGHPILLCVLENLSGIILGEKFFTEEFNPDFLELFGGSLSAIHSIMTEVLKNSGNLRVIVKDKYAIMMEPRDQITGVLVVDRQSFELRRKLQIFINRFLEKYDEALKTRKNYSGPVDIFKLEDEAEIFNL